MVPFKSATIVASSGGKLFLVPLQSVVFCGIWWDVCFGTFLSQRLLWSHLAGSCFWFLFSHFFCRIWREFVLVPFQSASIDAASWREVSFWFLLSQRLLWPHLAGSCFWFLFSQQVSFWFLFSQRLLLLHFAGGFFFTFYIYTC